MVVQTPTNNNERSSDEILKMAVWLDMESGPAGYGEEEMNFSARRVPDVEVEQLRTTNRGYPNDRNESK